MSSSDDSDEDYTGEDDSTWAVHDAIEEGDMDKLLKLAGEPGAEGGFGAYATTVSSSLHRRDHWKCTPAHVALLYTNLPALALLLGVSSTGGLSSTIASQKSMLSLG